MKGYISLGTGSNAPQIEINKPVLCSHCHRGIDPKIISYFTSENKSYYYLYVAMKCPICEEIFFAKYDSSDLVISRINWVSEHFQVIGGSVLSRNFSADIEKLSPEFVKIYNDAYKAEQAGYSNVVGLGYRLAFEKLIKDFCISEDPSKAKEIKEKSLAACIADCKLEKETIEIMKRTAWLGNDFSHYESRHPDFDVGDLKKLIDICILDIETSIKRKHYINSIQPKK